MRLLEENKDPTKGGTYDMYRMIPTRFHACISPVSTSIFGSMRINLVHDSGPDTPSSSLDDMSASQEQVNESLWVVDNRFVSFLKGGIYRLFFFLSLGFPSMRCPAL